MARGGLRHLAGFAALATGLAAGPAIAAERLDGGLLPPLMALPFAALLLSIAFGPMLAAGFWHKRYGTVALFWALCMIVPLFFLAGLDTTRQALAHVFVLEYLPFVILLSTLFTLAGGIHIRGRLGGTPAANAGVLALGAGLASLIGTTGAAIVLVRPLIRANAHRRRNAHVMVFFIFLVGNIGGALTPLGDPPLFLGFLRGVDFFWTLKNLWVPTLFSSAVLLALFWLLDLWFCRGEPGPAAAGQGALKVEGMVNFILLAFAIALIVASGTLHVGGEVKLAGIIVPVANVARDCGLLVLLAASMLLTPAKLRHANNFEWAPMLEVTKLFAAIFVCLIPVLAMLGAGRDGPFAAVLALVTRADGSPDNPAYFWAAGLLSSFLDNAPTYLVFFEMAGGDPAQLMGKYAATLAALSLGAVFMGANTYLGNAPNFIVYAIARRSGVKMPGFFGYMAWAIAILLPLFAAVTWLFIA